MITVEKGRPMDTSGRIENEIRSYGLLDSLGIEYTRADHMAANTMEACEEIGASLGVNICKNLLLTNRQNTVFYILLMPGEKPFKTKELSGQLGVARLSFASAASMKELLDITPGSLSVLGLMNDTSMDVTLLIDEDITKEEYFGCHPCINTSTIKFKTSDLFDKLLPALARKPIFVKLSGVIE